MGPSGAGKTTLLNALAGRTNTGRLEGSMYMNSAKCESLRATSSATEAPCYAFVMQDDHHNPMLTVKETLIFAAMLRKRTSNRTEVMALVDTTLDLLGLARIADDFVNTPERRTMSNGQLRRLTIGVEVVCAPPLIFLDEPTSGLSSFLLLLHRHRHRHR
jgi:ABC-type multidrug transport system ATPase subunit